MRSQTTSVARSSHARPAPAAIPARCAAAVTAAVMSSDGGGSATGAIHGACGTASGVVREHRRDAAVGARALRASRPGRSGADHPAGRRSRAGSRARRGRRWAGSRGRAGRARGRRSRRRGSGSAASAARIERRVAGQAAAVDQAGMERDEAVCCRDVGHGRSIAGRAAPGLNGSDGPSGGLAGGRRALGQERARGEAGQAAALAREVRLVGVAGVGGETGERSPAARDGEEALEPQHAAQRARPVADGALEPAPQLALAQRALAREPLDARLAVAHAQDGLARRGRRGRPRSARRRRRSAPRAGARRRPPAPRAGGRRRPRSRRTGTTWSSSSDAGRPSALPAIPTRKRTPQRRWPGVAGARSGIVAGPATISRPPVQTMSTHASGRTRVAPPPPTHTHATCCSSPGGGASSRYAAMHGRVVRRRGTVAGIEQKRARIVLQPPLEAHADPLGHPDRGRVGRIDQADQARQPEPSERVGRDRPRRLGRKPLAPVRPRKQVGDLDLGSPLDRPRQQAAAADERAVALVDRRPQPELGVIGVPVEEPFELLPGFLAGQRALGEVAPDLGVAVQGEQRVEVVRLEAAQDQPVGLEDPRYGRSSPSLPPRSPGSEGVTSLLATPGRCSPLSSSGARLPGGVSFRPTDRARSRAACQIDRSAMTGSYRRGHRPPAENDFHKTARPMRIPMLNGSPTMANHERRGCHPRILWSIAISMA